MDNKITLPCDVSEVSDGYHTFSELYDHRCLLWVNVLQAHKESAFKTWRNDVGEKWDGWFIAGLNTEHGQITYHLPEKLWSLLDVKETEKNEGYDGHTPAETLQRLEKLAVAI